MRSRPVVLAALGGAFLFALLIATPTWAQSRVERRLALASGGRFVLDTEAGGVTITGDSASGATVTVTSDREDLNDRYDFQFEERAGEAKVTVKRRGTLSGLFGNWSSGNMKIEVHVPKATVIDVHTAGGGIQASALAGNVRVDTSGGGLDLRDIIGDVDGHTSGGSIHIAQVRGAVDADTSGGGIDVNDVRGPVRAHTSGGSIQVRNAADRVDAHTSGGSVSVTFAPGNNRGGDLSSSGGGVRADIDPRAALSIDASTSGGSVTTDLGVTVRGDTSRRALRGDVNGGGAMLRMRSSGGGVRLSALSATAPSR